MIIQATIKFEVYVELHDQTFESKLIEIMGGKEQGELKGDIERIDGRKIFTISNSDVHGKLHGLNLGFQFYTATISKCLDLGATEFRSSHLLNENSTAVWKKIERLYYNCSLVNKTKKDTYYCVKRDKELL
jgi:hypothetical protein